VKASQFAAFVALAEKGTPRPARAPATDPAAQERQDFDISLKYLISLLRGERL
jgi:hypothetical protein